MEHSLDYTEYEKIVLDSMDSMDQFLEQYEGATVESYPILVGLLLSLFGAVFESATSPEAAKRLIRDMTTAAEEIDDELVIPIPDDSWTYH
jgi:hypothetical protein